MFAKLLLTAAAVATSVGWASAAIPTSFGSGAPVCTNPSSGVLKDWYGGTDTYLVGYYMNTVQIQNTSTNCAYKVGIASYKAYEPYTVNVFSQTYFASQTTILQPGQKWSYTVAIPPCTFQTDVFWGDTLYSFTKPNGTYGAQGRLLDAWYFPGNAQQQGKLPTCAKVTPTPTPKPSSTPTPTVTLTPKPSRTPTPIITPSATPMVTTIPTKVVQKQVVIKQVVVVNKEHGQVLGATPTPAPTQIAKAPVELPNTGPGASFALALGAPVLALIARKFWM